MFFLERAKMNQETTDLIVGIHSIKEALLNSDRKSKNLYITKEGLSKLRSYLGNKNKIEDLASVKMLSPGELQSKAQQVHKTLDYNYARVSGGMFLLADALIYKSSAFLYDLIDGGAKKFLVLDQVTDAHNAGAIFRTAAFYGVDGVIHSCKGSFGRSPGFFKIASGAAEHVHFITVPKLGQCISKLLEKNVQCIGITEDGKSEVSIGDGPLCLILGAEESGISFNIKRLLDTKLRLEASGPIETLNVSIASAVAMEKLMSH
jgi:23S rRNA (guanosine2251-2'-O)-methyltransferase